jgi:outer membrane protein assembly factor BamB
VGDVLIDLGEMLPRGREQAPTNPPRRRPTSYRAVLATLAVLLAATLTASTHRTPPSPPVVVQARLGDMTYVTGDRLFVVSAGGNMIASRIRNKTISEYGLPHGELLSRTTVSLSGVIFDVAAAGSAILVSYQVDSVEAVGEEATVAVLAGTGRTLWQHPSRLLAVSAANGLVVLRENSPQYRSLNWQGVELMTGRVRWSLRQPVRGFTTETGYADGFPEMLVTATTDGDIEVRDTVSGAVTASAKVPVRDQQAGSDVPVWPAGDLILVGAPEGTTAYTLPGLVQRWHSSADLAGRWVQPDCATLICSLNWQGGVLALDRVTGVQRWADPRWNYADQAGPYLLASENSGDQRNPMVVVLNPADGRILGDFGQWHTIGAVRPDGLVLGLHEQVLDDTVFFALLDPADRGVRVLGAARDVSGDCQTADEVLVCRRIDASVGIWQLK